MANETFTVNEPPKDKRYAEFFLQSYIRKNELINYLETLRTVGGALEFYAVIEHDHDVFTADDESVKTGRVSAGDPKKPHNHFVLKFKSGQSKTVSSVRKMFDRAKFVDDQGKPVSVHYCEVCGNRSAAVAYLTHTDAKSKEKQAYVYPQTDIVYSGDDARLFFQSVKESNNAASDITACILEDMLSGCTLRDIAQRYGRDFIYHYHCFRELYRDIMDQEKNAKRYPERNLED